MRKQLVHARNPSDVLLCEYRSSRRPLQALSSCFSHSNLHRLWQNIKSPTERYGRRSVKSGRVGKKKRKEKHGYWLDNCLAISNDLCWKPSGRDLREESSRGCERRLKLPTAPFYPHRPISAEKNKNGNKKVDGSLARRTAPAGARGPARVLPLAIFFQERDEAFKKKKKKRSQRWWQKCLLQGFTNVIGFH